MHREERPVLPELTERENEILGLIAEGFTNRGIADQLCISESTVENHIHHIYGKLGITNRAQAVAHALRVELMPASILYRGNPS